MPGYKTMYGKGGSSLDPIPAGNKGLRKLSKTVRNKMGYMGKGGSALESSMNKMTYKHGGSCGRKLLGRNLRKK